MQRVIAVTLNPAIDLTGNIDELHPGELNLVNDFSRHCAGKGINVARILADLGADVTVTGFLGNNNQMGFESLFEQKGLKDQFLRVDGRTRVNIKLAESNTRTTEINFPGFHVDTAIQQRLFDQLRHQAGPDSLFILSGSLPQGVEPWFYAELIRALRAKGATVYFDSSSAALTEGVKAGPHLIKPNLKELSHWCGKEITTLEQALPFAHQLHQNGVAQVAISASCQGAITVSGQGVFRSTPPKVNVVSEVGAGDTLVAGLAWAAIKGWDIAQGLRFATALASWTVSDHGVHVPSMEALDYVLNNTQVEAL